MWSSARAFENKLQEHPVRKGSGQAAHEAAYDLEGKLDCGAKTEEWLDLIRTDLDLFGHALIRD